jgi:5-methyltetrahydropteroyltriglutamate--homocysteine methyltransferase
MKTSEKILHAEVVGSLQRPEELMSARAQVRAGTLTPEAYKKIEDAAVDTALALQDEVGLEVVTDGEMRRDAFVDFFISGMSGLSPVPGLRMSFHDDEKIVEEAVFPFAATEKVVASSCPGVAEFQYAAHRTDKLVKVTLPSPMLALNFWGEASRDVYPDPYELAVDAAVAVEHWMQQLADAGCQYIQIDAPEVASVYIDQSMRDQYEANGIPTDRFVSVGTELLARLGRKELPGVRKAVHVCKGSGIQSWMAAGGYGEFTKHVFRQLEGFDTFHMEYDDDRSGDFEPLSHLPDDKTAVLGLVSTRWSHLEDPDELVARIDDAARFHPKEHLAIAPQCGFASVATTAEERMVLPTTQRDKLKIVTSVAKRVWG